MLSIVLEFSHLLSSSMSPNLSHDIAPLPSDLSKLNVPQLKAICKERRIVGYSKLGKAALIRKLGELAPSSQSPSSAQTRSTRTQAQTSPLPSAQVNDSLAPAAQRPTGMMPTPGFSPREPNTVPGTHIPQPQSSATSGWGPIPPPPSSLSRDRGQNSDPSASVPVSKRIYPEISLGISQGHASAEQARPLAKKPKVVAVSSPLSARCSGIPFLTSVHVLGDGGLPDSSFSALPGSALVPGSKEKEGHQLNGQAQVVSMSGKRFKPLEVTRPLSAMLGDGNGSHGNKSANVTVQPSPLWHLDFPASPEPSLLSAITIPPPLSQRKLVQRWAVILSGLSDKECLRCCLVSKLIRYAGERLVSDYMEYILIHLDSLFIGLL
jgi:hypothetical protein